MIGVVRMAVEKAYGTTGRTGNILRVGRRAEEKNRKGNRIIKLENRWIRQ